MRAALCFLLLAVCPAAQISAQDFRIRNQTWFGDAKVPMESVTVFKSGIVYDFLFGPDETLIYDAPRQQFISLDPVRQVKLEVAVAEVEKHIQLLRAKLAESNKPFAKFQLNPQFKIEKGPTDDHLELSSDWMDYSTQMVKPPDASFAAQYFDFLDANCKFGSMNPNIPPPFGRLALNNALRARGKLAAEVRLTMFPKDFKQRQQTARTEHKIRWSLLEEDNRRIDETATQLVTFKMVGPAEFRRPAIQQAKR